MEPGGDLGDSQNQYEVCQSSMDWFQDVKKSITKGGNFTVFWNFFYLKPLEKGECIFNVIKIYTFKMTE